MESRFVEIRMVRMGYPSGQIVSDDVVVGYWELARCKSFVTVANMRQVVHLNVPAGEFCQALKLAKKKNPYGAVRLLAVIGAKTCVRPVM